jgi:purine-binding chemotaxis protein CheW
MMQASPTIRAAVAFRVGGRALAVDAADVAAVARRPALTRVPQAPPALAGVGALNGRATPVIELAALLGEGEGGGAQLLLLRGDDPVALAVDHVEGIREPERVEGDWLDLRAVIAPVFQAVVRSQTVAGRSASPDRARRGQGDRELGFLQFSVAGQSFALPIEQVRAVARAPVELSPIAGADPVVAGVAPHGEGVLPVVELADLLGLPRPAGKAGWMVVVEIGGAAVGLHVERLLGALRLQAGSVSPSPAVLNRGSGEARVTAIARTPAGLTAILSPDRLFDEDTTRRLEALAGTAPVQASVRVETGSDESLVVFRLGGERYALPTATVEAVGRAPAEPSAPPNAPAFLAGVMSHRGEVVPLVDLRQRFGIGEAQPASTVLFVRSDGIPAGLLVDGVERVARIARAQLQAAPALAGVAGALFRQVTPSSLRGAQRRNNPGVAGEAPGLLRFARNDEGGEAHADEAGGAEGQPLLVADVDTLLGQARRDLSAWAAVHRPEGRA